MGEEKGQMEQNHLPKAHRIEREKEGRGGDKRLCEEI